VRTLVYGLWESGVAATKALLERGEEILAADAGDDERLRGTLAALGVEGALGAGPGILDGVDRVVVSPGVPPCDPVLRAAEERGVPVVPEVGLGLEMLGSGIRVVAITGTNGKTTVVDLLHRMLERAGVPSCVAGNSWRALTGCLDEVREAGLLLLEVSSFQLHYLEEPGFEVAALLNARPDHLNWHASFEEYAPGSRMPAQCRRPKLVLTVWPFNVKTQRQSLSDTKLPSYDPLASSARPCFRLISSNSVYGP
jgi:UDP-N-acetylmuramoylalanine--D-glutamate ligase